MVKIIVLQIVHFAMLLLHFGTAYLNILFVTYRLTLLRSSLVSTLYSIVERSGNCIVGYHSALVILRIVNDCINVRYKPCNNYN